MLKFFYIFKSDFKHAVEAQYSERDTLKVLRSCLSSEPAKLIEGISSDLNAAWKYLDQNQGPKVAFFSAVYKFLLDNFHLQDFQQLE